MNINEHKLLNGLLNFTSAFSKDVLTKSRALKKVFQMKYG